jgi:uncharacterized protein YegP (UPF0339 family)
MFPVGRAGNLSGASSINRLPGRPRGAATEEDGSMRIEVVTGPDERYRFRMLDDGGDVLITSEPYAAKHDAFKSAEAFQTRLASVGIEDRTSSSAARHDVAHAAPGGMPPI